MPRNSYSSKKRSQSYTRSLTGSYQQSKTKKSMKTPPLAVVKRSEAGQVADFVDYRTQQSEIRYDVEQVLPKSQPRFALASLFQNATLVTALTSLFSTFPKK